MAIVKQHEEEAFGKKVIDTHMPTLPQFGALAGTLSSAARACRPH